MKSIACGADAAKHFGFGPGYRNLNHGSFGIDNVVNQLY